MDERELDDLDDLIDAIVTDQGWCTCPECWEAYRRYGRDDRLMRDGVTVHDACDCWDCLLRRGIDPERLTE